MIIIIILLLWAAIPVLYIVIDSYEISRIIDITEKKARKK